MNTYREKSEWLMRDNPALKKIRFRTRMKFFIWLAVIELATVGLTASMIGLTDAAIPLGILMAVFLPILILKPSSVFTTRYGKIKDAEVHTAFVITGRGASAKTAGKTMRGRQETVVTFTVENNVGKTWKFTAPRRYEKVFLVGDGVIEIAGLEYPVDLTPQEFVLCPYCGNIMPNLGRDCVGCGEDAISVSRFINETNEIVNKL